MGDLTIDQAIGAVEQLVVILGTKSNGNIVPIGVGEDGHLLVDILATIADAVSAEPTRTATVEDAFHAASAAKVLTGAWVNGDSIATSAAAGSNKTHYVAECTLANQQNCTRVDVGVDVSIDGGTTWVSVQTEDVASDGSITLAAANWQKTVSGDDTWAFSFNVKSATHFRVRAMVGVGSVGTDALLVRVRGGGV